MWALLGPFWAVLGFSLGPLGAILDCLGAVLARPEAILSRFGALVGLQEGPKAKIIDFSEAFDVFEAQKGSATFGSTEVA